MSANVTHVVKRRNRLNAGGAFGLGTTTPAYAWDFVNNKARFASIDKGALANTPGWSATPATHSAGGVLYASTASGALQSFASGTLRRTDKGVLIEGARTNLCLQSQTFDNAAWTKDNGATVADQTVAPDGTTTADTFVPTAASAQHRFIASNVTVTSAATYAMSYYVKPNGYTKVGIREGVGSGAYAAFSLSGAGSVLDAGTGTGSVEALANGWYRITLVSAASGTTFRGDLWVLDPSYTSGVITGNWTANGTSGIYPWGAQLELGGFPSSYIPTTTASATRAADTLSVPVTLASPLTMYAEFEYSGASSYFGQANRYAFQVGLNNTNRAILYNAGTNGANRCIVQIATATQANPNVGASIIPVGSPQKVALTVATNDFRIVSNGTLGTPDTSGTALSDITIAKFGGEPTSELFGYLRRCALWPRALTDSELQTVTR